MFREEQLKNKKKSTTLVLIGPGWIMLNRMPYLPHSAARDLWVSESVRLFTHAMIYLKFVPLFGDICSSHLSDMATAVSSAIIFLRQTFLPIGLSHRESNKKHGDSQSKPRKMQIKGLLRLWWSYVPCIQHTSNQSAIMLPLSTSAKEFFVRSKSCIQVL